MRTIRLAAPHKLLNRRDINALSRLPVSAPLVINEEALTEMIEEEPMIAVASDAYDDAGDAVALELATPTGERRRVAEVQVENSKLLTRVEGRDAIIAGLKEDKSFLRGLWVSFGVLAVAVVIS